MVRKSLKHVALTGTGVGAACFAYGSLIERRWYTTRSDAIQALNWQEIRPTHTEGMPSALKIMLFSDLHFRPGQEHRLDYVICAADRTQPDLIVSAGDNLEHPDGIEPVIATHRVIAEAAPSAKLIVALGAHDRYGPARRLNPFRYFFDKATVHKAEGERFDTDRLIVGLCDAGWQVPVNGQGTVETILGRIHYSVVDDPHIGLEDLNAVSEPSPGNAALSIGITHAPYKRVLNHFVNNGVDLLLAGHTHGGQVRVPFYGALVSNCDLPPAQARGLSDYRGVPLLVTAGLGHSTYAPFRFACRPEVRILGVY